MADSLDVRGQKTEDRNTAIILCLYGDLGSGKTTFTQGFIRALGIEGRVLSPTFTLVREYPLPSGITLHHFDLYRLKEADQTIDIQELIHDPSAILLIEWADRMNGRLPEDRIDIFFTTEEDERHTIIVKNVGEPDMSSRV